MKKIMILCFALLCIAGIAFALSTSVSTTEYALLDPSSSATKFVIKPSTNVTVNLLSAPGGYAINSSHKNGDRIFGTSWDSQVIYYTTTGKTPGTDYQTVPTNTSGATAFSGWKSL